MRYLLGLWRKIPSTKEHTYVFDVKVEPQGTSFGIADEKCADCGKIVMYDVAICYHHKNALACAAKVCVYTAQVTKK